MLIFSLELKAYRNDYTFKIKFRKNRNNSQQTSNTIHELITPISQKVKSTISILNTASGEITDPSAIANEFNNYFVNIGTEIASSHQTNCNSTISTKYLSNTLPSSIFLEPPSVSEMFNLIHTLNLKKVLETMKYQRIYYVFLLKLSHLYYATYLRMFMNSVFFRRVSKPQSISNF